MPSIQELRDLLDHATPRPWFVDKTKATGAYGVYQAKQTDDPTDGLTMICRAGYSVYITPIEQRNADMALIVEAVNLLPKLLDEIERLRKPANAPQGMEPKGNILPGLTDEQALAF